MALLRAFIDPEFVGIVIVYAIMFIGAWIWVKFTD